MKNRKRCAFRDVFQPRCRELANGSGRFCADHEFITVVTAVDTTNRTITVDTRRRKNSPHEVIVITNPSHSKGSK